LYKKKLAIGSRDRCYDHCQEPGLGEKDETQATQDDEKFRTCGRERFECPCEKSKLAGRSFALGRASTWGITFRAKDL
jgi:hypothetical protein